MRILVAAVSTPGHGEGGMERHLDLLTRMLEDMGHEAHVLTTPLPPGRRWGRHLHVADAPPSAHGFRWRAASRAAFLELQAASPFDRVVSEGMAASGLADVPRRPPLAAILHGFEPEHLANRRREIRGSLDALRYVLRWAPGVALSSWTERRLCRSADKVWTAAPHIRESVTRWYGVPASRVEVLSNWLDDSFKPAEGARERLRAGWEAGPDQAVFLFAGVLTRQKGGDIALRAFDLHARRHPGSLLVVAGGGPELDALKRETLRLGRASRTRFLGPRPNAEMPGILAAADVFVFPTLRIEGLPYAALEAASVGLAAIASPLGGASEVFGESAVYASPGDVAALAEAMDRLAADPERRRSLAEGARRRAAELFGRRRAEAIVRSWLEGPA